MSTNRYDDEPQSPEQRARNLVTFRGAKMNALVQFAVDHVWFAVGFVAPIAALDRRRNRRLAALDASSATALKQAFDANRISVDQWLIWYAENAGPGGKAGPHDHALAVALRKLVAARPGDDGYPPARDLIAEKRALNELLERNRRAFP